MFPILLGDLCIVLAKLRQLLATDNQFPGTANETLVFLCGPRNSFI